MAKRSKDKDRMAVAQDLLDVMSWANTNYRDGVMYQPTAALMESPRLMTGNFGLDFSIGGGLPTGHVCCFFGPESGGKSTQAVQVIARLQQTCMECMLPKDLCACEGGPDLQMALWNAIEGVPEPDWMEALGVDMDRLVVAIPDSGEEALHLTRKGIQAKNCGIAVVDSLAGVVPESELQENSLFSLEPGAQARLVTKFLRGLQRDVNNQLVEHGRRKIVLFINQIRTKIGVVLGNPETMTGAHAMRHASSLTVRFNQLSMEDGKKSPYYSDGQFMATRHSTKIYKSKMVTFCDASEYIRARFPIPEMGLKRGQIKDFNTVLKTARKFGVISSERPYEIKLPGSGGVIRADTLEEFQELWRAMPAYYYATQKLIFDTKRKELLCQDDASAADECSVLDVTIDE